MPFMWFFMPSTLKLQGLRSESDDDKLHMIRVRAVHSAYKSDACYCVTLLCDELRLVDHHCKCTACARAFPCSHAYAALTALSRQQGEQPTNIGALPRWICCACCISAWPMTFAMSQHDELQLRLHLWTSRLPYPCFQNYYFCFSLVCTDMPAMFTMYHLLLNRSPAVIVFTSLLCRWYSICGHKIEWCTYIFFITRTGQRKAQNSENIARPLFLAVHNMGRLANDDMRSCLCLAFDLWGDNFMGKYYHRFYIFLDKQAILRLILFM